MITGSIILADSVKKALFCILLLFTLLSPALAQNGQSELLGANGDGLSLQSALVGSQLVYAHINPLNGQLKFAQLLSTGWSEQVVATGFGPGSSLAIGVSPSGTVQLAAVSGNLGSLSYFTRSSNGAWLSEIVSLSNVRPGASLHISASETLISFSTINSQDLMVARKTTSTWTIVTVDASADSVGRDSSIGVSPNSLASIAYFDETNKKLKVALSPDRINWSIESIDFPGAKFGKLPQLIWLTNSELSIFASDVIQDSNVGGQGIIHAQRSPTGQWSLEQLGHPGEATQIGKFVASASNRNSALITRSGGGSSIINAQRATNGLWSGVTAFIAPAGEILSELSVAVDSVNTLNYFARATIGTQTFIRRASGVVLTTPPSNPTPPEIIPLTPSPIPAPSPAPAPVPSPAPTPEPRSGVDTDGDGISDADEAILGTNPLAQDTDGDGVFDGQELADNTSPTSANYFLGSTENKICSFWTRKRGISLGVNVTNQIPSTLKYSIEISTNSGQLKGVDERIIEAKATSIVSIDQLIKVSGNLPRGQVCLRFIGRQSFMSAKYFETKAAAVIARSSKRRETSYLLQHDLTSGIKGNQELSLRLTKTNRGERLSSELNLQNTTQVSVRGQVVGVDSKGRQTGVLRVTITPESLVQVSLSKLKLTSNGRVLWNPSQTDSEVRAVYEQDVSRKVGKEFSSVKISRQDSVRK